MILQLEGDIGLDYRELLATYSSPTSHHMGKRYRSLKRESSFKPQRKDDRL